MYRIIVWPAAERLPAAPARVIQPALWPRTAAGVIGLDLGMPSLQRRHALDDHPGRPVTKPRRHHVAACRRRAWNTVDGAYSCLTVESGRPARKRTFLSCTSEAAVCGTSRAESRTGSESAPCPYRRCAARARALGNGAAQRARRRSNVSITPLSVSISPFLAGYIASVGQHAARTSGMLPTDHAVHRAVRRGASAPATASRSSRTRRTSS